MIRNQVIDCTRQQVALADKDSLEKIEFIDSMRRHTYLTDFFHGVGSHGAIWSGTKVTLLTRRNWRSDYMAHYLTQLDRIKHYRTL